MKKVVLLFLIPVFLIREIKSQAAAGTDSAYLISLNQQIDQYVVQRNAAALDTLYALDFVFSHGSGKVEGKAGWMTTVERTNYTLRQHDSVTAELHPGVAVIKGKMSIQRVGSDKTDRYQLKYIRVYAWRKGRWWLVSHNTTFERHEP
ncbi:MAG: nuclear transport factor 2 family protein [Bacteroidota bacterium]